MRKIRVLSARGLTVLLLGLLSGCNGATVQPSAADGTAGAGQPQSQSGQGTGQTPGRAQNTTANPGQGAEAAASDVSTQGASASGGLENRIDQLSGRLTLLQEQVIQLKGLSQQQAELGQAMLSRLQLLTEARERSGSSGGEDSLAPGLELAGDQLDVAIAQLMQTLNTLEGGAGGEPFALATAYTAKGAWILLRYRTDSGESWIADGGRWTALQEEGSLPASRYRIDMLRADQDVKGYVAVRIDQQTGQSWWLNDRRWQVYQ